ncbi:MAG: HD domain-containing protein [Chitinophagaceae bacterium]|nr:HD domain-containing protein [Chitinophagaceae bacterium]
MDYSHLLKLVEEQQRAFFHSKGSKEFVFHNLPHTEKVVAAANEMARHYELSPRDHFIATTAAWFHDTGYFLDGDNHEEHGAQMAAQFLRQHAVPEADIEAVRNCILATRMPQSPNNLLEEIVCDADLFHLGTEAFNDNNKNMRRELELRKGIKISKDEWRANAIKLLETHHYFTDYARNKLQVIKQFHLDKLKSKQAPPPSATVQDTAIQQQASAINEKKRPDRGIETMFRITSNNNQRLSDMADNKAQIMITVNSIILSAVISILLRKLEEYSYLAWPTYAILLVSVLTIIFSILATRPNLLPGTFTQKRS